MFALLNFLLLGFISWSSGNQDLFFKELQTELNEQNDVMINDLSCGYSKHNVHIGCDPKTNLLTSVSLYNLSLNSVPPSICGEIALTYIKFQNAGLLSLPSKLGALTNLSGLSLDSNLLSSLPQSMAALTNLSLLRLGFNSFSTFPLVINSFSNLAFLVLHNNSLTTIPNELSTLPFLKDLYLNDNPTLQVSTELFITMEKLKYLNVANTLVSGLMPFQLKTFYCNNSCVSFNICKKNLSCPCSSFFADFCPDSCSINSQQLCVDCSTLVTQQQCSGDCSWCSGKIDGLDCYWCDLDKNKCSDSSKCNVCSGHSVSAECDASFGCEWCKYGYCASAGECSLDCSILSESESECESETVCSWCSSYATCLDSTAQCLSCDRFSSSFCPPGCDCSSSSDSNSNSTVVIVVCVVCCVVFFLICVGLFVLFVLKKRTVSKSNEMNTFLSSNSSLRFDNEFGLDETSAHPIVSRYSECCVDSFFRVSQPILSFSSSGSPLRLCSPVTVLFEMTNICGIELVVESLFVRGFTEKHEFVFSPSSFTIGVNEKRKISVELTMNCSATLSPSHSFVCCGVSNKQQWCSLCGIQVQSELSPLLSCDDIELKRELGRGAFGKVFLGFFKGTEVAVKTYSLFTQENNEKEANIFSKLHSPHIVTFYGISQTLNAVIIEYCKYGSVERLYDRKEMTDLMRLLICYDCSLGMKYLHSNGILHRDLKPDNLLIVSFSKDVNTVRAKISDFGTSRFVNQTMKMTESVGTPSYMAPEVFNNESYGKKSDVYSFGLTAWAIYSKQTPYSELPNVQTIMVKVNEGYRPQLCQNCPLNDLIERCWHSNPDVRPSFDEITEILKQQI